MLVKEGQGQHELDKSMSMKRDALQGTVRGRLASAGNSASESSRERFRLPDPARPKPEVDSKKESATKAVPTPEEGVEDEDGPGRAPKQYGSTVTAAISHSVVSGVDVV